MTTSFITGVDFITVPTNDFEASREFYRDTLGLPEGKQWGTMPAVEFQAGALTIAVMDPTAFGQPFVPHSVPIAFQVDDVAVAREGARGQGREVRHGHDRQRHVPPGDLPRPGRQLAGPAPHLRGRAESLKGGDPHGAGLGHQKIRLVWQGDVPTENVSALRSPSLSDLIDHSVRAQRVRAASSPRRHSGPTIGDSSGSSTWSAAGVVFGF